MGAAQKFLFDVSFDEPNPADDKARKAPPEATFSRAALEAARAQGFDEGRADGLAAAAQSIEQCAAIALETLARNAATTIEGRAALTREIELQALGLLRAALATAVPALCRKDPLAEIEALIAHCLSERFDEPRLVLRVGDGLFDAVQSRLAALAQAAGFAGKLVLLADPALGVADARVEWADGGAERDTRRLAAELDAVLARALAAPPIEPPSAEEKPDE